MSRARTLRKTNNALQAETRALWRSARASDFNTAYQRIQPRLNTLIMSRQKKIANLFFASEPMIMESFNSTVNLDTDYDFNLDSLAGTAGNGEPVDAVLSVAIIRGKQAILRGESTVSAQRIIGDELARRVASILSDTARTASLVSAKSRSPYAHYVRVLTPPSCGRCAVLAGQFSGKIAFERHPNCDCTAAWSDDEGALAKHYAYAEDYLNSLNDDDLQHVLGSRANARAWKDGADLNQLVNAYRKKGDVRVAQELYNGQRVKITYNGTTRRSVAHYQMEKAGLVARNQRATMRLMPESIYQIAGDNQALALKLLRTYGWLY